MKHPQLPVGRIRDEVELRSALKVRETWARDLEKDAFSTGDAEGRADAQMRRNTLIDVEEQFNNSVTADTRLFISYSESGNVFYSFAKTLAEDELGFKVLEQTESRTPANYLHPSIRRTVQNSTAFLGIWTGEYSAESQRDDTPGDVPSVWLPYELGLATAFRVPFRVCLADGLHHHYSEKTGSDRIHKHFGTKDYQEIIRGALFELRDRVVELRWKASAKGEPFVRD